MARYEVPFSITLSTTDDTTALLITCANATVRPVRVTLTDEFADLNTDRAVSFKWTRAASASGGTGTVFTPRPLGSAPASQCTAKVDFSAEPTYSSAATVSGPIALAAGCSAIHDYDPQEMPRAWGTQVLALHLKAAATRTEPVSGVAIIEE